MDEGCSEKGSTQKSNEVKGKGFIMNKKPSIGPLPVAPKASVELRTGASNEEAIKKINTERARIASMTPQERKNLETEAIEKEAREMAVEIFDLNIKQRGEYSETLIVGSNGNLDKNARLNDQSPPYIVNLFDLSQPQNLYELMRKIGEENPGLQITFENDSNAQWVRYKVSRIPPITT